MKQSFKIDTCRPLKDYNFDFEKFEVAESWGGVLYTVNHDATAGPWIDDGQPSKTAGQRSLWFLSAVLNSPTITLQPTRQMDGTTDITFDVYFNSSNAGFQVDARGQWGGPLLVIKNQNLTLSGNFIKSTRGCSGLTFDRCHTECRRARSKMAAIIIRR